MKPKRVWRGPGQVRRLVRPDGHVAMIDDIGHELHARCDAVVMDEDAFLLGAFLRERRQA